MTTTQPEESARLTQELQNFFLRELLEKYPTIPLLLYNMANHQKTELHLDMAQHMKKCGLLARDDQGWYLTDRAYEIADKEALKLQPTEKRPTSSVLKLAF